LPTPTRIAIVVVAVAAVVVTALCELGVLMPQFTEVSSGSGGALHQVRAFSVLRNDSLRAWTVKAVSVRGPRGWPVLHAGVFADNHEQRIPTMILQTGANALPVIPHEGIRISSGHELVLVIAYREACATGTSGRSVVSRRVSASLAVDTFLGRRHLRARVFMTGPLSCPS
jgi:RNA:NAD 2'-phosphotransferase (TPT1/KptA family)